MAAPTRPDTPLDVPVRTLPAAPGGRSWRASALAAVIVGLLLVPVLPLLLFSLGEQYFFPQLVPEQIGTRAWRAVLDTRVLAATGRTVAIGAVVTLLSLAVALPAGRALGLSRFRGRRAVELLLLLPVVVPTIAVAVGLHLVFIRYGLDSSFAGVVLVHLVPSTPYAVLVLAGVFANYDTDYEAQARSLGASWTKTFWTVTLPLVRPGLLVAGLFAFLISWSQYVLTLLIGGGQVQTLPILLFAFASGGDVAITSALTLVYVVPVLAISFIVAPHLTGRSVALGGFGRL